MNIWYRASRINNTEEVFSGDGGLFTAARWNHKGRRIIYCSESIALCTLEWLSHNGLSVSGFDYYRYSIHIPEKLIKKFTPTLLPKEWNITPTTDITRNFVEQQLYSSTKYIALALPSVLIPEEFNLVINPAHKKFSDIFKSVTSLGKHAAPRRINN